MNIRKATYRDAPGIKSLLELLGYTSRTGHLVSQLDILSGKEDHEVFVYDLNKEIVGFVSVHYLPQLAFDGDLMIITYLSSDESIKGPRIASELEVYITNRARIKKCDRIQVHCMDWRTPTHQFYVEHGYQEYPKYFTKRLIYGE